MNRTKARDTKDPAEPRPILRSERVVKEPVISLDDYPHIRKLMSLKGATRTKYYMDNKEALHSEWRMHNKKLKGI